MSMKNTSLFLSGFFFGGAVDHLILALLRFPYTAYGFKWGVVGNWFLAALDATIAALLYWFFLRKRD